MTAAVRVVDAEGVPVLVVDPAASRRVFELVDQVYRQHLHRRGAPVAEVEALLDALEVVTRAGVSANGRFLASEVPGPASFMSTATAADVLGVHERTIRRRAASGKIPGARRHARAWLIPTAQTEEPRP